MYNLSQAKQERKLQQQEHIIENFMVSLSKRMQDIYYLLAATKYRRNIKKKKLYPHSSIEFKYKLWKTFPCLHIHL